MGKTTLCNAITGLVPARGSIRFLGEEILGLAPHAITAKGIGYVPQGRRVWPSLTVDEHLRLAARAVARPVDAATRVPDVPATRGAQAERRRAAVRRRAADARDRARAALQSPPAGDGRADRRTGAGHRRAGDGHAVDARGGGRDRRAADRAEPRCRDRRRRYDRRDDERPHHAIDARRASSPPIASCSSGCSACAPVPRKKRRRRSSAGEADEAPRIFTVRRASEAHDDRFGDENAAAPSADEPRAVRGYTRWNAADSSARPRDQLVEQRAAAPTETPSLDDAAARLAQTGHDARVVEFPVAASMGRAAYVAGTFDTKGRELMFVRSCLEKLGVRTVTVDLATSGKPSPAMVHPREVARHHPKGERAVFTGDRGSSVEEMAVAFAHYVTRRRDLGGIISAGGSGGTALATAAMRRLPVGVPKVMVSTVASGDVKPYVGPADICMMYSVTDIAGINRISEKVLVNAAHALAGMIAYAPPASEQGDARPALGLTMFGLTTPCVQAVTRQLESDVRLPRVPCDRHRRAVDGEARGVGTARRRHRRHDDRDHRRDRRRRAFRRPRAARRVRARRVSRTSDRAARSTCATSGRWTRCRSDSARGGCIATIRT